jgi:ABC-type lipoprotein release transport system permease subunit
MESNFNNRDAGKRREVANGNIFGIKASDEAKVTSWDKDVIEGEFLSDDDTGKIVVGKNLIGRFTVAPQDKERAMEDLEIGDKVLLKINGYTNEFVLKGVLNGKTDATRQGYISDTDMKKFMIGDDVRASQIAVRVKNQGDEYFIKKVLVGNGFDANQKVQTYEEGEPTFVKDIGKMFSILGSVIGSVGLIVASITIFIIIYINALTRRKYIGIMKGIGISPSVIEISYVMQSVFYGVLGSLIGACIVYFILIPVVLKYPIDFPFSDGILVAPYADTFLKFSILMFFTVLAGYIPARSIVKQNTLAAILGR